MKDAFRGYFAYDQATFDQLWENAIFTVDTCALLDLYRLHKSSADLFLAALDKVKDRVWLPYQTSKEFFKNYDTVTAEQFEAYEKLTKYLTNIPEKVSNEVERHPRLPIQEFRTKLGEEIKKIISQVEAIRSSHNNPEIDETLLALDRLFAGKMGKEPDEAAAQQLNDTCKARFAKKIPPGYLDKMKDGDGKYGDAIIWLELISLAKSQDKDIIFITSEKKADWFRLNKNNEVIGPRRELIQEMYTATKRLFYIYRPDSFVERLEKFLGVTLPRAQSKITLADDLASVDRERVERRIVITHGGFHVAGTKRKPTRSKLLGKGGPERMQLIMKHVEELFNSLEPTLDRMKYQVAQLEKISGHESYQFAIENIRLLATNPEDKRTVKKIYDEIARLRRFYSDCITPEIDGKIIDIQMSLRQREYEIKYLLDNLDSHQDPSDL